MLGVPLHKLKPKGEDKYDGGNQPETHVITKDKRNRNWRYKKRKYRKCRQTDKG